MRVRRREPLQSAQPPQLDLINLAESTRRDEGEVITSLGKLGVTFWRNPEKLGRKAPTCWPNIGSLGSLGCEFGQT